MPEDYTVEYRTDTPRLTISLRKEMINGQPRSPGIQRFDESGRLLVDLRKVDGEKIVELLESDDRYGEEFWKLDDSVQELLDEMERKGTAVMPQDGISVEMVANFEYLEAKNDKKAWVPAEAQKVSKVLNEVIDVFQMRGVRRPEQEDSHRRIKSSILEILDVLEVSGVYPEKEEE